MSDLQQLLEQLRAADDEDLESVVVAALEAASAVLKED